MRKGAVYVKYRQYSLERESWRVMEDDSKDEKSWREVGNCMK